MEDNRSISEAESEVPELDEPSFVDSEATLLAKRVVPIEVAPAVNLPRSRAFGFAGLPPNAVLFIAVAALIGLLSGLAIAGFKWHSATQTSTQNQTPVAPVQNQTAQNSVNTARPQTSVTPAVSTTEVIPSVSPSPSVVAKAQPKTVHEKDEAKTPVPSETEAKSEAPSKSERKQDKDERPAGVPVSKLIAKERTTETRNPSGEKPVANPQPQQQARSADNGDGALRQRERRQVRRQQRADYADDDGAPKARRIDRIRDIFSGPPDGPQD